MLVYTRPKAPGRTLLIFSIIVLFFPILIFDVILCLHSLLSYIFLHSLSPSPSSCSFCLTFFPFSSLFLFLFPSFYPAPISVDPPPPVLSHTVVNSGSELDRRFPHYEFLFPSNICSEALTCGKESREVSLKVIPSAGPSPAA